MSGYRTAGSTRGTTVVLVRARRHQDDSDHRPAEQPAVLGQEGQDRDLGRGDVYGALLIRVATTYPVQPARPCRPVLDGFRRFDAVGL